MGQINWCSWMWVLVSEGEVTHKLDFGKNLCFYPACCDLLLTHNVPNLQSNLVMNRHDRMKRAEWN
jgi:hypothetical protein